VPLEKHQSRAELEIWKLMMSRLKPTILCIDDHCNSLIGRKMLLENNGYEVLEASGADEGMKLFLSHSVDLVVLDDQMPGMNGDAIAAKMKSVKSHVPIMLLSAYLPLSNSKLEAVGTFLSKSQPPTILLSTLQDLLNNQPKPFFRHWIDAWRSRNEGARQ
jgi:response regulator RpfG family c-di-GMP phosphodiesterase